MLGLKAEYAEMEKQKRQLALDQKALNEALAAAANYNGTSFLPFFSFKVFILHLILIFFSFSRVSTQCLWFYNLFPPLLTGLFALTFFSTSFLLFF